MKNTLKALLLGAALSTAFIGSASADDYKIKNAIDGLTKDNNKKAENKALRKAQNDLLNDMVVKGALKLKKAATKEDIKKFFLASKDDADVLFHDASDLDMTAKFSELLAIDKSGMNFTEKLIIGTKAPLYVSHKLVEILNLAIGKEFDVNAAHACMHARTRTR